MIALTSVLLLKPAICLLSSLDYSIRSKWKLLLKTGNGAQNVNADGHARQSIAVFCECGTVVAHGISTGKACLLRRISWLHDVSWNGDGFLAIKLGLKGCVEWNWTRKAFASLDALGPCMIKLCVADISTVLEPSTTTSTTAAFPGFLSGAALWTCSSGYSRDRRTRIASYSYWFGTRVNYRTSKQPLYRGWRPTNSQFWRESNLTFKCRVIEPRRARIYGCTRGCNCQGQYWGQSRTDTSAWLNIQMFTRTYTHA